MPESRQEGLRDSVWLQKTYGNWITKYLQATEVCGGGKKGGWVQ